MGTTLAGAPKPWRGYPNMNAVHGIRLMHRVGGAGIALPRGTPKGKFRPIGTLPPNSFVTSMIAYVRTAYGAGFTVDIGGGPLSDATPQVPTFVVRRGPRSLGDRHAAADTDLRLRPERDAGLCALERGG